MRGIELHTKRSIDEDGTPIVEAIGPFGHAQYRITSGCQLQSRVKGQTNWEHDKGMASLVTMIVDLGRRLGCYGPDRTT